MIPKYRVIFSCNYEEGDYDWDENPIGTTTTFAYSDGIEVDHDMTIKELYDLKQKTSERDYGESDAYTDIQIEQID